jgi:ParB family chromosome partitioning protein
MADVKKGFTVKRGLGKGLGALLPKTDVPGDEKLIQCSLSFIEPDSKQPRKRFDPAKMAELVRSIKEKGVVQPVLVRPAIQPGRYKLVAGERRWRAAQQAGVSKIPALVLTLDDRQAVEISLIENLQRENLNPVEEAQGYQRLIEEFDFNHEEVAKTLGKDRSTVTNMVRLLNLPPAVLTQMEEGRLSMGHGRALLAAGNAEIQTALAEQIIARQLSVRQIERMLQQRKKTGSDPKVVAETKASVYEKDLCNRLGQAMATRVNLRWRDRKHEKGSLEIEFYSAEELERLVEFLTHSTVEI